MKQPTFWILSMMSLAAASNECQECQSEVPASKSGVAMLVKGNFATSAAAGASVNVVSTHGIEREAALVSYLMKSRSAEFSDSELSQISGKGSSPADQIKKITSDAPHPEADISVGARKEKTSQAPPGGIKQATKEGKGVSTAAPVAGQSGGSTYGGDFKVFIMELPNSLNKELVDCYYQLHKINIWDDDGKEKGQNVADIWLHRLLESHPSRTLDVASADAIYIPYYGFLSSLLGEGGGKCNGHTHQARVETLAQKLRDSPAWAAKPHAHVLAVSYWGVASDIDLEAVITGSLYPMMKDALVLLYEKQFGSHFNVYAYQNWTGQTITIPYVASRLLSEREPDPSSDRRHFLYFRGNLNLDTGWYSLGYMERRRLISVFNLPDSEMVDSSEEFSQTDYAEGMRSSVFCLVPRGDTPSSRRLFDAIVSGCIPVIISDQLSLPFAEFIDWGKFSVQVSEADLYNHADGVVVKLRNFTQQEVVQMRQNLKAVRKNFIYGTGNPMGSYVPGNAVSYVLNEIEKRIKK